MTTRETIIQITTGQDQHGYLEMYALTSFGRTLERQGNGSKDTPFKWVRHLPAIERNQS